MSSKTRPGNYFEDFRLGQEIVHATPRTMTDGDVALYIALFGSRFAVTSSAPFAADLGLERAPIDSLLAFHIVFGNTVPDISLNAVANLGYANGRFGQPVYPGDTLSTTSTVIGLRQNKDGKTGVVYVRSLAEHMMATRLYQNTARVHFNQHVERDGRFGRRIIYGGHIISLVRSLSFNGLANALNVAAINGGRHTNPTFAGDTVYAWSEILDKMALPDRADIGALRLRSVATRDRPCHDFPYQDAGGKYDPSVVLDFDYTVLMPRRA